MSEMKILAFFMKNLVEKASRWVRHFGAQGAGDVAADDTYAAIVGQARHPAFYARFGVPDTLEGRFDMIVLHLWLVLRRLREDAPAEAGQALFNRFCADMDGNLREMGVGDLTVPKRMRKFGEAFYGRAAAYDAALAQPSPREVLVAALDRNVFGGAASAEGPGMLADYVMAAQEALRAVRDEGMGRIAQAFPDPARAFGAGASGATRGLPGGQA